MTMTMWLPVQGCVASRSGYYYLGLVPFPKLRGGVLEQGAGQGPQHKEVPFGVRVLHHA